MSRPNGVHSTEFLKFGEVLEKVHRQLDSAQKLIEAAGVRKRAMESKLRDVQSLSVPDANRLLELNAAIEEADPDRVTEDADADD